MIKEYFSHDYNARQDPKIIKLIKKYDMAGYGIFWAIVEELYKNENKLELDYELHSYHLRVDEAILKSIINDFGLFVIGDNYFYSNSVAGRINERNEKTKKGKDAANSRWGNDGDGSRKKATECIFYIIKIYSENEQFIKVGITSESVSRRYSGKLNGYKYELLFACEMTTVSCLEVERITCEKFTKYTPKIEFGGYLECIEMSNLDVILNFAMQQCEIRNATGIIRNTIKENKSKGKEIKGKEKKELLLDAGASENYKKFFQWGYTDQKAIRVFSMEQPLTPDEFDKLLIDFNKDDVFEVILSMENYKDLLKKNLSANLTIRNWLSRKHNKQ